MEHDAEIVTLRTHHVELGRKARPARLVAPPGHPAGPSPSQAGLPQLPGPHPAGALIRGRRHRGCLQARLCRRCALQRALCEAELRICSASLQALGSPEKRNLQRAQLAQQVGGQYIEQHLSVLITGAKGTGKTFLACALED